MYIQAASLPLREHTMQAPPSSYFPFVFSHVFPHFTHFWGHFILHVFIAPIHIYFWYLLLPSMILPPHLPNSYPPLWQPPVHSLYLWVSFLSLSMLQRVAGFPSLLWLYNIPLYSWPLNNVGVEGMSDPLCSQKSAIIYAWPLCICDPFVSEVLLLQIQPNMDHVVLQYLPSKKKKKKICVWVNPGSSNSCCSGVNCVYVYIYLDPFICRQTLRLFLCLGYCK